jgi:hypothetical protein
MSLFASGQIVITAGAQQTLHQDDVYSALIQKHLRGDWGNLGDEDKNMNDLAVKGGEDRIFSKYCDRNGHEFYIITEWDRSLTTILLCNEY